MLNVCLQKYFIKKRHTLSKRMHVYLFFSSEFEGALFTMAGQICLK